MRHTNTPQSRADVFTYSTHNPPDSPSSTSKLLPRHDSSESTSSDCGRIIDTRSAYSTSQSEERTRIFTRRKPSPMIGNVRPSQRTTRTFSSSSDNTFHGFHHHYQADRRNSDVFLSAEAHAVNHHDCRSTRVRSSSYVNSSQYHQHRRSSSVGSMSFLSRTSSLNNVITPLSLHQSSLAQEAVHAPRISRSSTQRSIGQEWTRYHWQKIKDLQEESERARKCSKLSSGFAPLMVFGGLVFVCIGISASTNTGKDRERLKELSAAPLAMGIFMIILGASLILTWFGCRSRARQLDQKLLHGSCGNLSSSRENLMQTVVTKLYNQIERAGMSRGGRPPTPTFSEIVVEGASLHKVSPNGRNGVSQTQTPSQRRRDPLISRETSV